MGCPMRIACHRGGEGAKTAATPQGRRFAAVIGSTGGTHPPAQVRTPIPGTAASSTATLLDTWRLKVTPGSWHRRAVAGAACLKPGHYCSPAMMGGCGGRSDLSVRGGRVVLAAFAGPINSRLRTSRYWFCGRRSRYCAGRTRSRALAGVTGPFWPRCLGCRPRRCPRIGSSPRARCCGGIAAWSPGSGPSLGRQGVRHWLRTSWS